MFGRKKVNVEKWLEAELEAEKLLDAAAEADNLGDRKEAERLYNAAVKYDERAKRYA